MFASNFGFLLSSFVLFSAVLCLVAVHFMLFFCVCFRLLAITLHFLAFPPLLFFFKTFNFCFYFFARRNRSSVPAINEPAGEVGGAGVATARQEKRSNLHVFSALRPSVDAARRSVAPLQTILYECQLTQHCRPGKNKPGARQ